MYKSKRNVSASSIAAFKACPERYRFAHVLGVRQDIDPDTLRIGTNWHAMLELYHKTLDNANNTTDFAFDMTIAHLNERYQTVPDNKSTFEWATERAMLVYSFMAYIWVYEGDTFETLLTEHKFSIPIVNPETGRPDRIAPPLVGKIDRIVKHGERAMSVEYKTTSSDIAPAADYWHKLKMDTQVSVYTYAMRRDGWEVAGTLYDVFRKPAIRPRLLTQAETKKFITTGEWCGGNFEVAAAPTMTEPEIVEVNNVKSTEVKIGAKGWQFRETPEMYGVRLLQLMYSEPEKYFARKEIARTDKELRKFEVELYNIAESMKLMVRHDNFYRNEAQCDKPYPCAYRAICYHNRNESVIAGETPSGFKRLFKPTIGATDARTETPTPSPAPFSSPEA
jgi:hypothetical protein